MEEHRRLKTVHAEDIRMGLAASTHAPSPREEGGTVEQRLAVGLGEGDLRIDGVLREGGRPLEVPDP
jgi:hypothetical protein